MVDIKYAKDDLSQVNPQLYEWLAIINDKSSYDDRLPQNSYKSNPSQQKNSDSGEEFNDPNGRKSKDDTIFDDFKERITNYSEQGKLIILNKKRVKDIFDATGIETSELSKNLNSENNIPDTLENVNPSQQNNSDSGKEFDDQNGRYSKDDTIFDDFEDGEVMFTADGDIAFDGFGADAQRFFCVWAF